jgi:large subunit ribosomal protein L19
MQQLASEFSAKQRKGSLVDVRSGDTVRVHQRIQEGGKTRTQVFEGLVIRVDRRQSLTARITVRRLASGVGVEKSFLLHSPLIEKVEVIKRSRVRRNYLSYMRARSGKSARLAGVEFDRDSVNAPNIEAQRAAAEAEAGVDTAAPVSEAPKAEAAEPETAETKAEDAETKAEAEPETKPLAEAEPADSKEDKAAAKKAKAEAFRQAHDK